MQSYKVYTALLNQSGTGAPVPTILENTIGSIVWSRVSTGIYHATLSGAFPDSDKVAIMAIPVGANGDGTNARMYFGYYNDLNSVEIVGIVIGTGYSDNIFYGQVIEIRVYN
jgi:hypothetical protein